MADKTIAYGFSTITTDPLDARYVITTDTPYDADSGVSQYTAYNGMLVYSTDGKVWVLTDKDNLTTDSSWTDLTSGAGIDANIATFSLNGINLKVDTTIGSDSGINSGTTLTGVDGTTFNSTIRGNLWHWPGNEFTFEENYVASNHSAGDNSLNNSSNAVTYRKNFFSHHQSTDGVVQNQHDHDEVIQTTHTYKQDSTNFWNEVSWRTRKVPRLTSGSPLAWSEFLKVTPTLTTLSNATDVKIEATNDLHLEADDAIYLGSLQGNALYNWYTNHIEGADPVRMEGVIHDGYAHYINRDATFETAYLHTMARGTSDAVVNSEVGDGYQAWSTKWITNYFNDSDTLSAYPTTNLFPLEQNVYYQEDDDNHWLAWKLEGRKHDRSNWNTVFNHEIVSFSPDAIAFPSLSNLPSSGTSGVRIDKDGVISVSTSDSSEVYHYADFSSGTIYNGTSPAPVTSLTENGHTFSVVERRYTIGGVDDTALYQVFTLQADSNYDYDVEFRTTLNDQTTSILNHKFTTH